MTYLLYPLIVLAGCLQALGNSMNAQLKNSLENPWLASFVSFALIIPFFVWAFAVNPRPLPTLDSINNMLGGPP